MRLQAFGLLLSVAAACAVAQAPSDIETSGAAAAARLAKDKPAESVLRRARSVTLDLRRLPQTPPQKFERPEYEEPEPNPVELPGAPPAPRAPIAPVQTAPAPAPSRSFDGLDFATWGAGHPPDTNGDVGPTYYIQTINTSIGVYRKSDQQQVAAFTFNTFMSQGAFGNLCDTNNFGDPVVLYDTFEDRWVITDFAFQIDGGGNVVNPPGAFQCFAVSKTGDPVSGGWNFYSINVAGGLGDYPKFGIWTDGIYMSANVFGYPAGASFQNSRVFAFNKAQMYAGNPTVQVVSFNAPPGDFTLLPSNARLQTGTPPPGTPAYFVSTWQFLNALTVYKFHVDWTRISNSTFTGPDQPLAATSWPNATVANAPSLGGNSLDVLQIRAMMQNQYTNLGGVESLWTTHTVRRANTTGFAAPRWYQVDVTGGTVAANIPQATTWDPDGANVLHRFVPSLAIDRAGDLAIGYTTSSSTTKPALAYAGRLAGDPVNTFSQTEQVLIQGTGTQLGNCGSSTCIRWGDYSAMTLDPDGCTFWYTGEYYAVDGLNHQTRIGSFAYPSCTPVGAGGTVSGTVTQGGNPLSGATVSLGSRTTTTDGSGFYSFAPLPAGTYPTISASYPGCTPSSASSIAVSDGNTTTQNFALSGASGNACLIDTAQADFQTGVGTNVDFNTSPGDVILLNADNLNQQNGTVGTSGVGITVTTWGGQTFTPSISGSLKRVDVNLFCSGCTGTTPNLTLSIRATSGGLPTGADLASATVTGFSSGASAYYTATFSTPFLTLNAGTQYALVIRPTANPSPGTYALTRSGTSTAGADVYAGGTRVTGATSGTVWSIPLTGGVSTDAGFKIYINNGFAASGDLISGVKDANPAPGYSAGWQTLSWTATTPANTAIQFQVAASNSLGGPFNFVGPDGTAATFFTTSGASLSQFNGNRYLEYRAYLSSTDNTMTPTLNDVTVCYSDPCIPPPPPVVTPQGPTTFCAGGNVTLMSSVATNNQWQLDGNPIGGATSQTYLANAAGSYTDVVTNAIGCASSASTATLVTVNPLPGAPSIGADTNGTGTQDQSCPEQPLTLHANGGSGVSYQWFVDSNALSGETTATYVATGAGTYSVTTTDANSCTSTQSSGYVVQNPTPAVPLITFRGQDSNVTTLTVCQGTTQIVDSDSPTGIQWWKDGNPIAGENAQSYSATQGGVYTAQLNALGCHSPFGRNVTLNVTPTPATPTVTPSGPTTLYFGQSVTLTSSSASGNQWYVDGNPINGANGQSYVASTAGDYTVVVTTSGCSSVQSVVTTVIVNPAQADVALSLSDHRNTLMIGDSVNYIIEVTNSAGPSPISATVTDSLPPGLANGSWVCIPFGGATCASGVGNSLSDAVTLPVGSEAAYVYSATVIGADANDQLTNSASVTTTSGTDPQATNNSASDADTVSIFIDGFEGPPPMTAYNVSGANGFVAATARLDRNLLGTLNFVPARVAVGRGADGRALFTLELARFAGAFMARVVTPDAKGYSQRSAWQAMDLDQNLLTFDWQSASAASAADGYIRVAAGGVPLLLGARDDQGRLTQLWVTLQNSVPWLVLVTH